MHLSLGGGENKDGMKTHTAVVAFAATIFVLVCAAFVVSVRVRYSDDNRTYAETQQAVLYCESADVAGMSALHREMHYRNCAEFRTAAKRKPTWEDAVDAQISNCLDVLMHHVFTWKFLTTTVGGVAVLLLLWLIVLDRPRMRRLMSEGEEPAKKDKRRKDVYE